MNTIQILGFIVLVLFYGSYFGKVLLQRNKGIITDRMGKGSKAKRTFLIEVILKVITYSMAAVQTISVIVNSRWNLFIRNNMIRYTGIIISLIGVIVFVIAMATMKDNWRAGVDATQNTSMVKTGIYKVSRNPAFLGFDLFYLGITLAFSNPLQMIYLVLCFIMFHLQILEEEKFLQSVFGQDYLLYKKTTGRYFLFF